MLGAVILTIFVASLPWPWYTLVRVGSLGVRPVVLAAIPVVLYFLWKSKFNLKPINIRVAAVLVGIYIVWAVPVVYNTHPHWQIGKLISLGSYLMIAYFGARLYLMLSLEDRWRIYWPVVAITFIVSCMLSYYFAFGTLVLDTDIRSSQEFIHGALYGQGVFSDPEAAKGMRHTMAIVPTLLLAMVVHNGRYTPKFNFAVFGLAAYLVLFSFSRSAWLVTFLICLLVFRYTFQNLARNLGFLVLGVFAAALALPVLSLVFPEQFSWVFNIVGDRVSDDKSTSARLWIIGEILFSSSAGELLFGYNRLMQVSPHNTVLDALLQSGILGAMGALIIVVYAIRVYFRGLTKGDFVSIVAAAFVAPALVRMFTAGSGMLHVADLTGLCIAANLKWYFSVQRNADSAPATRSLGQGEVAARSGKLLAGRTRFKTGM